MPQTLPTLSSRAGTPQPFYKNQKNFKRESSPSLSKKTLRSPHQSKAPYPLLSLFTSRAPKTFLDAQNILHTLFFSLTKLEQSFSPQKKKCQGKGLSLFPFLLFIPEPLLLPLLSSFSLLQLWKMPPSTSKTSPINTSHSHEVSCSLHIYSFASPPRIHMDSWWAARNPKQGLKWT